MADDIVSGRKDKPEFDEHTLAKLLEAAYVLQEHNRELQKMELREPRVRDAEPQQTRHEESAAAAKAPTPRAESAAKDDYTAILAQIVEVQHQIQVRRLALDAALALIVDRIIEITHAAGAGIGILDGGTLRYRAAGGLLTLPRGTEVPLEKALCVASLRVGDVIRCADVNPEFLIDAAECKRRGIQSLICVPVYHDGKTAGGLEVYYANVNAFSEPDVHSCQLMAGLVTEALARNEEHTSKNSLAAERAVMLEALEKLKPNLAALVDSTAANTSAPPAIVTTPSVVVMPPAAQPFHCRKCGHTLAAEEQFCGECGTPRSGEYEKPSMQSKVASMLSMQEATKKNASGSGANGSSAALDSHHLDFQTPPSGRTLADVAESELPELFRLPESAKTRTDTGEIAEPPLTLTHLHPEGTGSDLAHEFEADDDVEVSTTETALVKSNASTPWSSAAAAREFLERLAGRKPGSSALGRFLNARRGDVYLALAVILVACAIRWGIWSNHSVSATGNPAAAAANHRRSDADLPFYDRVLIKLGLAEAPDAPEDKGNPDVQVWVDLHTALYYCPGSDLYGKGPKGKYETQRDAQLDQFEPANRKACN